MRAGYYRPMYVHWMKAGVDAQGKIVAWQHRIVGQAILAGTRRPTTGRVVVTHLGVGLADLVFADAIVRRADELHLGVDLPR